MVALFCHPALLTENQSHNSFVYSVYLDWWEWGKLAYERGWGWVGVDMAVSCIVAAMTVSIF